MAAVALARELPRRQQRGEGQLDDVRCGIGTALCAVARPPRHPPVVVTAVARADAASADEGRRALGRGVGGGVGGQRAAPPSQTRTAQTPQGGASSRPAAAAAPASSPMTLTRLTATTAPEGSVTLYLSASASYAPTVTAAPLSSALESPCSTAWAPSSVQPAPVRPLAALCVTSSFRPACASMRA